MSSFSEIDGDRDRWNVLQWDLELVNSNQIRRLLAVDEILSGEGEGGVLHLITAVLLAYLYRMTGNEKIGVFPDRYGWPSEPADGVIPREKSDPFFIPIDPDETYYSLVGKIRENFRKSLNRTPAETGLAEDYRHDVKPGYPDSTSGDGVPVFGAVLSLNIDQNDADLAFRIRDPGGDDGLIVTITLEKKGFATEFHDRATVHLSRLLDACLKDPMSRICEVQMPTPLEVQRTVFDWNDTARDYPLEKILPQFFEEQHDRSPQACAVIFGETQLSYANLEKRANRLAHHLRCLGIGPDSLVAVFMERSLELMVAILGIMKAGGAYVPIDPDYPVERVRFVLHDSNASVVLADESLLHILEAASSSAVPVLLTSASWISVEKTLPTDRPKRDAGPANLACVIYTSGSTGQPKGVMVPHRGMVNRMLWGIEHVSLTAEDRLLQKTATVFDSSVWKFFAPLAVGGPVVLADQSVDRDAGGHIESMLKFRATVSNAVPTELGILIREASLSDARTLRHFGTGGEPMSLALAKDFCRRLPDVELSIYYGVTEASDISTCIRFSGITTESNPLPIGKPIANVRVYVLDDRLRPVPIGVIGEFYIGGVGVARGYLNQPEMTAQKFLPDAFHPGERMYRTGDRGYWRSDGTLVFTGRFDSQVKLRGFRVELGEIEAVLNSSAGVRNSVVMLREDTPGEPRLTAYVETQEVDATTLRERLAARLPYYMVPSAIVILPVLPLLPSGKVDRISLPRPRPEARPTAKTPNALPLATEAERTIAGIWSVVLGVHSIDADDNFFSLGGDSLKAVQAIGMLQKLTRVRFNPDRLLFESLGQLARSIDTPASTPGRLSSLGRRFIKRLSPRRGLRR